MEAQGTQVDAVAVVDALTYEIASLTRRAVIAEQRVAALEAGLTAGTTAKESK